MCFFVVRHKLYILIFWKAFYLLSKIKKSDFLINISKRFFFVFYQNLIQLEQYIFAYIYKIILDQVIGFSLLLLLLQLPLLRLLARRNNNNNFTKRQSRSFIFFSVYVFSLLLISLKDLFFN
jgi:hypothetical protein